MAEHGVEGVAEEHGIPREGVFVRKRVEHVASVARVVGFGVEEDELGGEEVIGCDGEHDEASVELLTLAEETVVGAALNGGAIGGEVDAAKGWSDPHSFVSQGNLEIQCCSLFSQS